MVKVLDTVVKVKLIKVRRRVVCLFWLTFCVAHKFLCTPKIVYSLFSNVHVLIYGFIRIRYKKQKGVYQDTLKETEVKGQAKCCSYLLNKKLYFFVRKKQ